MMRYKNYKKSKRVAASWFDEEPKNDSPIVELNAPFASAPVFDDTVTFEAKPDVPTEDAPTFEGAFVPSEAKPEPEFLPEWEKDITPISGPAKDVTTIAETANDTVDLLGAEAVDEGGSVNVTPSVSEHEQEDACNHKTPTNPNTEQNMFLCCITCTRMILISFKGDCPFSILKLFHDPRVSMMAFMTCRKCVNNGKQLNKDVEMFGREAEIALSNLHMSPKIITNSYLYKIASTIAPTSVNLLQDRGEVKYYPMHKFLDEMTEACMIMGVLTDESAEMKKENLLMPFVPGAFL